MTEPCGQPALPQKRQFDSDKPSCLCVSHSETAKVTHQLPLAFRLSEELSVELRVSMCVFVCACGGEKKKKMHVYVHPRVYRVCNASMRDSLKRSFIQKHAVQGEMSDELFRDFFFLFSPHSRKKMFLEVRQFKG